MKTKVPHHSQLELRFICLHMDRNEYPRSNFTPREHNNHMCPNAYL
jgi:hypothetical protein